MDGKKIEKLRKRLLEVQEEILETIDGETEEGENPFEMDGDLADRAEALTSVTITEGLTTQQKETLDAVRKALQKIKDGVYGKCKVCGEPIEDERLEAIPYAETCKRHMNDRY